MHLLGAKDKSMCWWVNIVIHYRWTRLCRFQICEWLWPEKNSNPLRNSAAMLCSYRGSKAFKVAMPSFGILCLLIPSLWNNDVACSQCSHHSCRTGWVDLSKSYTSGESRRGRTRHVHGLGGKHPRKMPWNFKITTARWIRPSCAIQMPPLSIEVT